MPKRILLIAFAAAAIALAACDQGYNPNDLYGTPAPTATTSTATPNPVASTAVVTVWVSSSPLPNQTVVMSTDVNGTIGSTIISQTTDSTGTTTFSNLAPGTNYCFSTTYTPAGGFKQTPSQCGFLWFDGVNLYINN
ncbi:MAG TPA: hypothetical protein VMG98_00300 [Verrucomicrobiae bacterium]|nr:hypothetical protein [Verrucomicrobiae bacterium]